MRTLQAHLISLLPLKAEIAWAWMAGVPSVLWPGVINPLVFNSFKQQLSYSQTHTLTGYLDYSNPLFVTVKSCVRLSPETELLLADGTSSLTARSPARIVCVFRPAQPLGQRFAMPCTFKFLAAM